MKIRKWPGKCCEKYQKVDENQEKKKNESNEKGDQWMKKMKVEILEVKENIWKVLERMKRNVG